MSNNWKYAIEYTLYCVVIMAVCITGHGFIIMPYEGSWSQRLVKRLCKYSGKE